MFLDPTKDRLESLKRSYWSAIILLYFILRRLRRRNDHFSLRSFWCKMSVEDPAPLVEDPIPSAALIEDPTPADGGGEVSAARVPAAPVGPHRGHGN